MPPEMVSYIPPKIQQVLVDLQTLEHPAAHSAAEIIQAFVAQSAPEQMPYVDLNTNIVCRGGVSVKLSPTTAVLMKIFIDCYPNLITLQNLRAGLYGRISRQGDAVVRVMAHKLRHQLEPIKCTVSNIARVGYRLELQPITP